MEVVLKLLGVIEGVVKIVSGICSIYVLKRKIQKIQAKQNDLPPKGRS